MRAILICFLALTPGVSEADISLIYPQQAQCRSNVSAIQISGSRMRFDSVMENKKHSMLFDGMEDIITTLDHSGRQYHQIEVDEDALDYNKDVMSSTGTFVGNQMNALQAQMKQQCAQMEKQGMSCANMPDLSSIMKTMQAGAGQGVPETEIRAVENRQSFAGMNCRVYDRYENGSKKSEECYIEPKDLLMPDKDKKYLLRNLKVMTHYALAFAELSDKLDIVDKQAPVQPDPSDRDILLSQVCFSPDGSEVGRIEVQVSNATIDQAGFEIPSGYTLLEMTGQVQ